MCFTIQIESVQRQHREKNKADHSHLFRIGSFLKHMEDRLHSRIKYETTEVN